MPNLRMPNLRPHDAPRVDLHKLVSTVVRDIELLRWLGSAAGGRRVAVVAAIAEQRCCTDSAVMDFLMKLADADAWRA